MIRWEKYSFNLCEEALKAVRAIKGIAAEKGLSIDLETGTGKCPVVAGPDRIQQVLINLLSNAVKYSPENGRITVSINIITADDGKALGDLVVKGRGPGLSREDRIKVFNKFFQATGPEGENPQGSGLGLTICREIIEHYGGSIRAESRTGGGSSFIFTLPLYKEKENEEPTPSPRIIQRPDNEYRRKKTIR